MFSGCEPRVTAFLGRLLNKDFRGPTGHPDSPGAEVVQPEKYIVRADLNLSDANLGRGDQVIADTEGTEAMDMHAHRARSYTTHQELRIGRQGRLRHPKSLRSVSLQ